MKQCLTIVAALGIVVLLAGCNDSSKGSRNVLRNLTPGLHGVGDTHAEHAAGVAVVNNTNSLSYEDDWTRWLMTDRPSSLSPFPIVQN